MYLQFIYFFIFVFFYVVLLWFYFVRFSCTKNYSKPLSLLFLLNFSFFLFDNSIVFTAHDANNKRTSNSMERVTDKMNRIAKTFWTKACNCGSVVIFYFIFTCSKIWICFFPIFGNVVTIKYIYRTTWNTFLCLTSSSIFRLF